MSDCDSEDYSSSEDEDYVPSGGEYSEDDVNELEKEEDDDEDQESGEEKASHKNKDKKNNKNSILARKRKKGILSLNSGEGPVEKEDKDENTAEDSIETFDELKKKKLEEVKKKREDDLWSSFLSDVGKPPKSQPTVPAAQNNQMEEEKNKNCNKDSNNSAKKDSERTDDAKKLIITEVFDFAGEEVKVTKEVDCSSREAKTFIKQQEKGHLEQSSAPSRTTAAASSGVKRPMGMSSILGKLGSKKKMSTLEKSKLDWESFKEREGIGEELAHHNRGKDGYIERKAFLERVDYRQFELEREVRLKNMKP